MYPQWNHFTNTLANIEKVEGSLENFALGYQKMGFTHGPKGEIVYREWIPGTPAIP